MKSVALAFAGLCLCAVAAWLALYATDPSVQASAAFENGDTATAVDLFRRALRGDNANAYYWADLGEALPESGQSKQARYCMDRALELAPYVPAIWVRHANFCFLRNDYAAALRSAARVLQTVPDYDEVLFNYFDRIVEDPERVLAAIGGQSRTTRAWLAHQIAVKNATAANLAWRRIASAGYADAPLAAQYVEFLLDRQSWDLAQSTWARFLGDRRSDYPAQNLLYNGNFNSEPLPGPLDWHFRSEPGVFETARGHQGVRITFHGKDNVDYYGLFQTAVISRPGRYRLSMHIKTEGITTNEGVRLAVADMGLVSEPITGTNGRTTVDLEFTTTRPRSVRVAVVRRPSEKFDNKIEGSAWVESVKLAPVVSSSQY